MRKLVLLGLTFAFVVVTAIPASAEFRGMVCRDVFNDRVRVCVTTNFAEAGPNAGDVEGLVRARHNPGESGLEWRVDWVHLYRNGNFVEEANTRPWTFLYPWNNTDPWQEFSTSFVNNNCDSWRAVARFQIRNRHATPDDYGAWIKFDSDVVFACGG